MNESLRGLFGCVAASRESAAILELNQSAALSRGAATKPAKPRKISFKEARELESIEPQIMALEAEVARIEGSFADPEFFRKNAAKVNELTAELDATKSNIARLYARWEELEAIKAAVS